MHIALILAITSFILVAAFLDIRARYDAAALKRPREASSYVGLLAGVYKSATTNELMVTLLDASVITETTKGSELLDASVTSLSHLVIPAPNTNAMLRYCSTWVALTTTVRIDRVTAGKKLLFFSIIDAQGHGLATSNAEQFLAV